MKPNQASNTAKVIAASTILLASDAGTAGQVAAGAAALCQTFLSGTRNDRWLARSAKWPPTRLLWRWLERLTLPGIISHYWHRKRWIESRCRDAIADGFERVIVLGAGYDTLTQRLAREFSQLAFIEVDHPATQNSKRQALRGDSMLPSNLTYVALDLSVDPLPATLLQDDMATIVVIEGMLMYLNPPDVDRLFGLLRQLSAKRVRIVFSFMSEWPDGRCGFRPYSWLIERWLAWRNEPFTWAINSRLLAEFLATRGFKMIELATTRDFSESSTAKPSSLEGENLVVCEPT